VEIVRLCAGLPLAVRVIGARLTARPYLRLGQVVDWLSDQRHRLDQLTTGDLAVRASLALSLHGLDGTTRRLFHRLSLLEVPDFSTDLAVAVAGASPEEAIHAVESLVEVQLLTVIGVDGAEQVRYRFHDLVRLLAREQSVLEDTTVDSSDTLRRGLASGWRHPISWPNGYQNPATPSAVSERTIQGPQQLLGGEPVGDGPSRQDQHREDDDGTSQVADIRPAIHALTGVKG
jgi:hypothetical protein